MRDNQQQNNQAIRQIKKQRFKLNTAQKNQLEKVFLSHLEPDFQQIRNRALLVNGIPTQYRNYIWTQLIPNCYNITPAKYSQLIKELNYYRTNPAAITQNKNQQSPNNQQQNLNPQTLTQIYQKMLTYVKLIEQDIPRTFPQLKIIDDKSQYEKLSNILGCFAVFRADIGYIQGLSLIGTLLLHQLNAQFRTFVALSTLVTTTILYDFYTFKAATIAQTAKNIIDLLKSEEEVYQLFISISLDIKMVVIEWIMTLFSRCFQLDTILLLYDLLLAHKMKPYIIQRLCATIIILRKDQILESKQEEWIGKMLKNIKLTFHQQEKLFKVMRSIQFEQE